MLQRTLLATATATAVLALALAATAASAQEVRLYRANEAVDPQEVARILDAKPRAPAIKMRSLRLLDEAGTAAPPASVAAATAEAGALALPVQFAFDSAQILPAARGQLDALAQGIQLLPAGQSVVIEGHTDAIGSAGYNDALSLQRAYSVKRYLVAVHGIEPSRLRAVGLGEYAALPGYGPYAPENRRVQFRGE